MYCQLYLLLSVVSDKKFRGQARPDLINIPSNKHESSNKRNSGVGGNGGERNAKTKQAVSASAGGGGGVGGERATNTSSAPALMKQQPLINKTADSSQNWRLDAKGKKKTMKRDIFIRYTRPRVTW